VQVLIDGEIALRGKIFPLREKWSGGTRCIAFYVTRAEAVTSEGEATAIDRHALGFSMTAKSRNKEFKVTGAGAGLRLSMPRDRTALREVESTGMAAAAAAAEEDDDEDDDEEL
jgi:hypothetical protein